MRVRRELLLSPPPYRLTELEDGGINDQGSIALITDPLIDASAKTFQMELHGPGDSIFLTA